MGVIHLMVEVVYEPPQFLKSPKTGGFRGFIREF
jgi:hypothetical protein